MSGCTLFIIIFTRSLGTMIINKVQPDIIFNTSDTQLNHSNIQELTIQSIQDSDNPTLFDSQMGLTDVVYTIFTSGSTGQIVLDYQNLGYFEL
jgi:acyl-coenzyme A synthetase/AMP-(fatty) acid ligase